MKISKYVNQTLKNEKFLIPNEKYFELVKRKDCIHGRDEEVKKIIKFLMNDFEKWFLICGPKGTGKTYTLECVFQSFEAMQEEGDETYDFYKFDFTDNTPHKIKKQLDQFFIYNEELEQYENSRQLPVILLFDSLEKVSSVKYYYSELFSLIENLENTKIFVTASVYSFFIKLKKLLLKSQKPGYEQKIQFQEFKPFNINSLSIILAQILKDALNVPTEEELSKIIESLTLIYFINKIIDFAQTKNLNKIIKIFHLFFKGLELEMISEIFPVKTQTIDSFFDSFNPYLSELMKYKDDPHVTLILRICYKAQRTLPQKQLYQAYCKNIRIKNKHSALKYSTFHKRILDLKRSNILSITKQGGRGKIKNKISLKCHEKYLREYLELIMEG